MVMIDPKEHIKHLGADSNKPLTDAICFMKSFVEGLKKHNPPLTFVPNTELSFTYNKNVSGGGFLERDIKGKAPKLEKYLNDNFAALRGSGRNHIEIWLELSRCSVKLLDYCKPVLIKEGNFIHLGILTKDLERAAANKLFSDDILAIRYFLRGDGMGSAGENLEGDRKREFLFAFFSDHPKIFVNIVPRNTTIFSQQWISDEKYISCARFQYGDENPCFYFMGEPYYLNYYNYNRENLFSSEDAMDRYMRDRVFGNEVSVADNFSFLLNPGLKF